ncbi:MAG TPA: hypothetical protein VJC07_01050 [Candidatus Nanoarchaeia archaeon]|nr:hypothetical protein [Candidatus Nanoarchaeia archaeon]
MSDTKTLKKRILNGIKIVALSTALALGISKCVDSYNQENESRFQRALSNLPRHEQAYLKARIESGKLREEDLKKNMVLLDHVNQYFNKVNDDWKKIEEIDKRIAKSEDERYIRQQKEYKMVLVLSLLTDFAGAYKHYVLPLDPSIVSNKEDLEEEMGAIEKSLREIYRRIREDK